MKKLLLTLLSVSFLLSCGPSKDDAVMLDTIMLGHVNSCTNAEKTFWASFRTNKNALSEFMAIVKNTKHSLESMGYNDLQKLKDAGINVFDAYIKAEPLYAEGAKLGLLPNDSIRFEEKVVQAKLVEAKISSALELVFKELELVRKEFASKYGYEVYY